MSCHPRAGKRSHSLTIVECILRAAPKEGAWVKHLGSYLSQEYLSREPEQQSCLSFEITGIPVWPEDLVCSSARFESHRKSRTWLGPVLPHPGVKLIHRPTYCWEYTQPHPSRKPDRESRKLSSPFCNHIWAVNQPSNPIQLFPTLDLWQLFCMKITSKRNLYLPKDASRWPIHNPKLKWLVENCLPMWNCESERGKHIF